MSKSDRLLAERGDGKRRLRHAASLPRQEQLLLVFPDPLHDHLPHFFRGVTVDDAHRLNADQHLLGVAINGVEMRRERPDKKHPNDNSVKLR